MKYLADNYFVHRDLAARNCLLSTDLTVKIFDFGLTKQLMEKSYYRSRDESHRIPIKWMALESIEHNIYTTKSDVWSYGVLLWELMIRGETPYKGIRYFQILVQCLKTGYRLENPINCPQFVYQLCLKCWQRNPDSRPDFDEIIEYFEENN